MARKSRNINLIVIHCSATRFMLDYSPDMMLRDHHARGFSTYGYHFYIRKSGQRVILRPLEMIGAHVTGFNRDSIGICYEGGCDNAGKAKDTRTQQQKDAIVALLKELIIHYPDAEICGHRDLSPDKDHDGVVEPHEWIKMCPSFDAKKEYKSI